MTYGNTGENMFKSALIIAALGLVGGWWYRNEKNQITTKNDSTDDLASRFNAQPYTGSLVLLDNIEWQKSLPPEVYRIMREHKTERACTNPLNAEKRSGIYHCAACDLPLFSSTAKYESHSGWPSFTIPIEPSHVGYTPDNTLMSTRIEVHCNRCHGHLGHVFDDGPPPTHHRYCINGLAMIFKPT